ncbi:protein kinase [Streptomyces sp. NPDC060006]|uniref:serine/threonine-protein kinase n=1 Tax=unclassified Streptomyces TaxID=2593676 RepID=UPI003679FB1D
MGEVFAGRYELVDPIGRGGVGAVWRAWDHRRRRYVAAKVLQQSDAHSLLRFVREQAVRIDHPHVLAPASWAADDDKVLFTMDLVGGGSLVHLIGDYGPLPPAFVCTLLDQLLSGLAAVHAEGIVHRDIKPANILLEATGTSRPRLRLSDFGISMRLGEPRLTETNYVVGTPGYFAPEQMLGADPDFPADLFAVGLVALYLLEGAKPDAKALVEHFEAHGTPGAPKGVPEPLWQVVASLLEPDPQARFRTATGARKALASARELLPEPGPDDELIEIFDQLGPLPAGFGPEGPLTASPSSGRTRSEGHDTVPQQPGPGAPPPSSRAGAVPPEDRTGTAWPEAPAVGASSSGTDTGAVSPEGHPFPEHPTGDESPGAHPDTARPRPDGVSPDALTGAAPPAPPTGSISPQHHAGLSPEPSAGSVPHHVYTAGTPPQPTSAPVPSQPLPPTPSDTGSLSPQGTPRGTVSRVPGHPSQPTPQEQHHPQAQTPAQPEQPSTPPAAPEYPHPGHAQSLPYEPTHVPSPQASYPSLPAPSPPPHPQPELHPQPQAQPREVASTASYTARDIRVPAQSQPVARHRAKRARRRPGPPMTVALPVLLLALVCFAVGFWALARI